MPKPCHTVTGCPGSILNSASAQRTGPGFAASMTRLGLVDEYQLSTVPIAIGTGHSPFAELGEHLKLDVVDEERFQSGALAQILVPKH